MAEPYTNPIPSDGLDRSHELLSACQVASVLGVSLRTTHRWCAEGTLPEPKLISGRRRWVRADLVAWLSSRGGVDHA
jgi:excisionase family DNA binding protein